MGEWLDNDSHAALIGTLPDGRNVSFVLTGGEVSAGRQGDIQLPHNSVSRQHAVFEFRDGE